MPEIIAKLSIEEEIQHCEKTMKIYPYYTRMHQEHAHIKEWLEELNEYRATKLNPKQVSEIDALYLEKCQEVNRLQEEIKCITG